MILVITLKQETKRIEYQEGIHVDTKHLPEAHVFQGVLEANNFLVTNTNKILGAWEINKDLTIHLKKDIIPSRDNVERELLDINTLVLDKDI